MAKSLPEIFVDLPEDIQGALETALESSKLPESPSRDQVLRATQTLVHKIQSDYNTTGRVTHLLDQVPDAVVDLLF